MPAVTFTTEDLKSSYQVQNPGWFEYEITKISEKPATTDGSPNIFVTFMGKSGEMEGVRITWMNNSKANWKAVPLFKAANGGTLESGRKYDYSDLIGCKVQAMTKRGDRFPNELVDFRPAGA